MSNLYWADTHYEIWLTQPFLCYVGETYSKHFADWLYGIKSYTDKYKKPKNLKNSKYVKDLRYGKGQPYSWMFGAREPTNLVDAALKVDKSNQFFNKTKDKTILKVLEEFKKELQEEERELYKAVGCRSFEQFKVRWYGQNQFNENQNDQERKNYWLNYHLDLLTGETQRLFLQPFYKNNEDGTRKKKNTTLTLIEAILQLSAIELDKINMAGIEGSDGKNKQLMKDRLLAANILRLQEVNLVRENKRKNVYIPTEEADLKTGGYDEKFLDLVKDFYLGELKGTVQSITADQIGESLDLGMAYAIGQIKKKLGRKDKGKITKTTAIKRMFVNVDFVKASEVQDDAIQAIADEVKKYLAGARTFYLSDEELVRWKNDNKGGRMTKYIEKQIDYLVRSYFAVGKAPNFSGVGKIESQIMGFFGQLATYGKSLFNLSHYTSHMEIFNVGDILSTKGTKLGTDTVIVVNGKSYGIQTKNPYQVYDGFKKEYKKSMTFDKIQKVKGLLDMDDNQWELFEQYNLNINNSTNPQFLRAQLEGFLRLYTAKFARLGDEEISKDLNKKDKEILKSLQGQRLHNVFWVLKGEIFPSSFILDGVIRQYRYFLDYWDAQKNNNLSSVIFDYSNTIQRNVIPGGVQFERAPYSVWGYQYVHTGNQLEDDLKRIKLKIHLQLQIPSIASLTFLK